jgi:GH15 family glucan-1,4-alpha-glucosidase
MPDYQPIAEHGLIGDLHTVALVDTDGRIDWYCCPRFDSPSVFGSLLDYERGGHYTIRPADPGWSAKQLYFPDTNVLITRFLSEVGVGEIEDFMPVGEHRDGGEHRQRIVRRVVAVRGKVRFQLECRPAFNYGRDEHTTESHFFGVLFTSGGCTMALESSTELLVDRDGAVAEFELEAGETATFVLEHVPSGDYHPHGHSHEEMRDLVRATVRFWRDWLAQSTYRGRWREMVTRSALTLKLLTYAPTGAIVAAPTTSLPEQIGGTRNWDYRYVWIRDAAFSLYALLRLGFREEADAFMTWLLDRFRESDADGDSGPLQIMYAVDGSRELPESELDNLIGYRESAPVRVGNGAAGQLQLDIYGELIDSIYLFDRYVDPIVSESWRDLRRVVEWVCQHWQQPDEGIWETRGGRQRFTYSRLMCWVALDRAVRIARDRGLPGDIVAWMHTRDEIYEWIMEHGWNEERQAFVQHEDTDVLDASLLMMPLVKFIAPKDPRWLSTLDAIGEELVSDSLVYRYNVEASPDGLRGDEGTFSICSFWYVEALARAGRLEEARLAFEKMLTYANHLGLFSEEIGPTGELLGNFPQAFTHLALISAAVNLDYRLG